MVNKNEKFKVSLVVHSEEYQNDILNHARKCLKAIRDVVVEEKYRESHFHIDIDALGCSDYICLAVHFERSIGGQLRGLMDLVEKAIVKYLEEKEVHPLSTEDIAQIVENLAQEKLSNLWKISESFYITSTKLGKENLRRACEEIIGKFDETCLKKRRK